MIIWSRGGDFDINDHLFMPPGVDFDHFGGQIVKPPPFARPFYPLPPGHNIDWCITVIQTAVVPLYAVTYAKCLTLCLYFRDDKDRKDTGEIPVVPDLL